MTVSGRLLEGHVAVVTGGGRGIGLAIGQLLADHGASGYLIDRVEVAPSIEAPQGFSVQAADVTSETDLESAFEAIRTKCGRVDILIANAGIVPPWRTVDAIDLAEWAEVFAVNVGGIAATIKHATPLMRENGGAIIVTASVNAIKAPRRQMAYTASKTALIGLVRTAALDLGDDGIRVNALAPGAVMTEAFRKRIARRAMQGAPDHQTVERELRACSPLGKIATEGDVANAALFLASSLSSSITGHVLPVDAGLGIM